MGVMIRQPNNYLFSAPFVNAVHERFIATPLKIKNCQRQFYQ